MVSSPSQHLLISTTDGSVAKVNVRDGSADYKRKGLFLLALLTSELFFIANPNRWRYPQSSRPGVAILFG